MARRGWWAVAALVLSGTGAAVAALVRPAAPPSPVPPPEFSRQAAVRWLRSQQRPDGSWRSAQYGVLRSGQSMTPFVAFALRDDLDASARRRVLRWLDEHTDARGGIGCTDRLVPDYPTYATSYALRLRVAWGDVAGAGRHAAWLLARQFTEQNGWRPADPAYGGWGMGDRDPVRPPMPGHVDLAMTRHALQALSAWSNVEDYAGIDARALDASRRAARLFLKRCQQPAGSERGFWFSPVVLDANKGGRDGDGFRPYGTATADGILALRSCRVRDDDPSVRAARAWLARHHRADRVPGLEPNEFGGGWATAMRCYYVAASAQAAGELWWPARGPALTQVLGELQRSDGSVATTNPLMKEDDPLVATGLALLAHGPVAYRARETASR